MRIILGTQSTYANSGFTLIEVMVVVAIVGILTALLVPAYQHYVAVSHGGQSMQRITNYVIVGQVCVQTGSGCDDLNSSISAQAELTEEINGGIVSINDAARLVFDNGSCVVRADIGSNGSLVYSGFASIGSTSATNAQCQEGAGL